ncbi:MAG: LPXTG cell wall anchor domain-containing protein [Actinobacteria bacterium]|nr:LPXTG cell wall anchor domain-containing protein [Actinomycetota bacterium]
MTARRSILVATLVALVALFGFASAAGAVDNPDYSSPVPPSEQPATVERTPASPSGQAATAAAQASTSSAATSATAATSGRQTLAITGSDTAGFAVIGALLLAGGAALLLYRRRVAA